MTLKAGVVRVLICEDSRTYAAGLRRMLELDGTIEVIAVHSDAESAIAAIPRLKPDLVTMDIELPRMSGLEAIEQIMSTDPLPILVISSHIARGSRATAAALTPLEFRLLTTLTSHPGQVLSRDQLLELVWGDAFARGGDEVKLYIRYLRTKIERDPANPVRIETVRGFGYRYTAPS